MNGAATSQPGTGPGPRTPDGGSEPTSPSSTSALARFEFEMGRGNEGTKVLMVEWDPTLGGALDAPTDVSAWDVSWNGKADTFSLPELDADGTTVLQRVYFLIPSGLTIPPEITIRHMRSGRVLGTKCMPAIFAPGLGVAMGDSGKRGVLHTLWAKRRAAQLEDEIRTELRDNSESVGLEMAVQERQWVIEHFGLVASAAMGSSVPQPLQLLTPHPPNAPAMQSPNTPTSGRLSEMLKGLRLRTSPESTVPGHAETGSTVTKIAPEKPTKLGTASASAHTAAVGKGMASLDAVVDGHEPASPPKLGSSETKDGLFALPMSPRSPEMTTSPFSFLK